MKILCVHQGHELYGSDRSFVSSVQIVRDAFPAATIDVLLPREGELFRVLQRVERVRTIVAEIGSVRSDDARRPIAAIVRTVTRARAAVRRIAAYDAVYVNTAVVADYILATRFSRACAVIHVREIPSSSLAKLAFSSLLAVSPAFKIFNSKRTRSSYWFVNPRRSAAVHNGVEPIIAEPLQARDDRPLHLLLIGRINEWKGHDLLLDAVASMPPEDRARLKVRMVGNAPEGKERLERAIMERVAAEDLQGSVELHPFSDDPSTHFAWADAVVVPSTRPEPFGRVAVEAMSAGRPVVAANHGGLTEIVRHGVDGLLFRPNDAGDLVACLHTLWRDRRALAGMGEAGRASYRERFSVDSYRAGLEDVLVRAFEVR